MFQLNSDKELPPVTVLQKTGWRLDLNVSGQSMAPLIKEGDTITITCKPPDELNEGDVVCFKQGDEFVLHRLIEVRGTEQKCFYEKGDAETRGHWISGSSVLGVLELINGKSIDTETALNITAFSKKERAFSEALNMLNLPAPPSVLSRNWRKIKTACRRMFMPGER